MDQPQENPSAPREPVENLPSTPNFPKDVDAVLVSRAMRRYRMEQRRHKRIRAKVDALPDGPRKDRLDERIRTDVDPGLFDAESDLAEAVLHLCPPARGYYNDHGASVVQLRNTLIIRTCTYDYDGNPRDDGQIITVPIAATVRCVVDKHGEMPESRRERRKKEEQAKRMVERLRYNNPDLN